MMRRGSWIAAGLTAFVAITAAVFAIYVVDSNAPPTLGEAEVKQLLRQLPYRFEFRPVRPPRGANGAVAGRAIGPHRTIIRFGISLGRDGEPVRLGPDTDMADTTGGEPSELQTTLQWSSMES
jgi:hypothetical protein